MGMMQECVIAVALEKSDGALSGVFCVKQATPTLVGSHASHARESYRLKPVLDCLHRELAAKAPTGARIKVLTERTAELEWLFELTDNLKSGADDLER